MLSSTMSSARIALALAAAAALGAAGPAPDWDHAPHVAIALSSFKFDPATITLHHGQPYVLEFTNTGTGGHDFAAKPFFAAATIVAGDGAAVSGGKVELGGGEHARVRLIAPAAGRYEVRCTHFMHSTFGMTGTIIVD